MKPGGFELVLNCWSSYMCCHIYVYQHALMAVSEPNIPSMFYHVRNLLVICGQQRSHDGEVGLLDVSLKLVCRYPSCYKPTNAATRWRSGWIVGPDD